MARSSSCIDGASLGVESESKAMVVKLAVAAAGGCREAVRRLGATINDKLAVAGISQDITT
eukprot:4705781-Pyramimonas_sp.AAC.1